MWVWFTLGWIAGSVGLYFYVYATAAEAPNDECVECTQSECTECPYQEQSTATSLHRAA